MTASMLGQAVADKWWRYTTLDAPHYNLTMNDLRATTHQPTTAKPGIGPALRLSNPPQFTDEQIEVAGRPPSLEFIFAAHLKLLALQDTEWCAGDR